MKTRGNLQMAMKRLFCQLFAVLALFAKSETVVVPLWPEGKIPDCDVVQNVPSLSVTLPSENTNGVLLVVSPGGSYMKWCEWEGKCAAYFNRRGMATALLRYRTPRPDGRAKHVSAWQDAQRAVRVCRANAKEWTVNSRADFLHRVFGRRKPYGSCGRFQPNSGIFPCRCARRFALSRERSDRMLSGLHPLRLQGIRRFQPGEGECVGSRDRSDIQIRRQDAADVFPAR